jgi:ribonuclease J
MQTKKLKIIPLGGLGEFGMNCLALRWEDDIIVIDAGLMFPESELLGVDIVVPDITYLVENKAHVRAIILTHGHMDHIGGLPWILSELKVPVYATEFTLAYVEGKLEEHQLLDETELVEIVPKEKFTIGPFTIEPIHVTHSLVDAWRWPSKLRSASSSTPATSRSISRRSTASLRPAHLCRVRQARRAGPAAGLDQRRPLRLHAQRVGRHSAPRRDLFAHQKEALLQLLLLVHLPHPHRARAGPRTWRKVAVIGRSMMESTEIAQDLGYIDIPQG